MISLYQATWKPSLGPDGQLPTTIRTGVWHHTDPNVWTELTANPNPRVFRQNYGAFTSIDQMLWKESYSGEDDQGIGAFFQYGYSPGNINFLQDYYGGGFVYKGLLPGRDQDIFGTAFASVMFSDPYRDMQSNKGINVGKSETAWETFYKCIVKRNLSVQPDIQYIAHPSGRYKDALVPGLRFETVF